MNKRFIIMSLGMIAAIIAIIIFAANRTGETSGKTPVTATFYPLAEFARQVGGDKVKVTDLTPPGTEPHDFEPSTQELVAIQHSKAFIYSGAGFEPWAEKILPDITGAVIINASYGVTLVPAGLEDSANASPDNIVRPDPHYYLDPVFDQQIVKNIADGLGNADPENRDFFKNNAIEYNKKLADIHRQYSNGLSSCTIKKIVTSHAAFSYLAKRYGVTEVAIAGISEEDPSPARLSEISNFVRENQIKFIFYESLASPRLSQTIATETGAGTLELNPIEGLTPDNQAAGDDFISLMLQNLGNLRLALGCR